MHHRRVNTPVGYAPLPRYALTSLFAAAALTTLLFGNPDAVAAQETGTVTGQALESGSGRPVASVQVHLVGTDMGTLTGSNGRFLIQNVPTGTFEVRTERIGYESVSRTVTVQAGQAVDVLLEMSEQALALDEIIVTGTAGQARRREIGNSIAQIRPDITEPTVTTDQLIQGRSSGVLVLASSGVMGGGAQIRLRGNVSATMSNQPLIYVDGVRIQSDGPPRNTAAPTCACESNNDTPSPLNDINPEDIDRIEIIRGPAASTLYGTEGAAGVIQIFTKRGRVGEPVWTAEVVNSLDWVRPYGTDAQPYLGRPELDLGMDRFLQTAWSRSYQLSVGGGTRDIQYYLSASFDDNEGIMLNDAQDKAQFRGNVTFRPTESLTFDWNSSLTNDEIQNTPAGTNIHGITANVYRAPNNFIGSGAEEDLFETLRYKIGWDNAHLIAGLTSTYAPTANFTNKLVLGYDRAESHMIQKRPFDFKFDPGGVELDKNWFFETFTVDYVGTYRFGLGESLSSAFSWGGQSITTDGRLIEVFGQGFPGPGEFTVNAASQISTLAEKQRVINAGAFLQNVFSLKDRYFLTLGLRVDGNSAFGEDLGLEAFPKASFSYVVSDEDFWPASLGEVKLRAAFGESGRAPGAFDAVRTWRAEPFGPQPAFIPGNVGNPELGPERTQELELGFDGSFFNDRLALEFTYFNQNTKDALFQVRQIPSAGFLGSQLVNTGEITNSGIEIGANLTLVNRADIVWDVGTTIATNGSEVKTLGDSPPFSLGFFSWIDVGTSIPSMRGTLIKNPDEIAEPILERNHIFGPNQPTTNIGVSTSLEFRGGIRLSARGEYVGGHTIYDHLSGRSGVSASTWAVCEDAGAYQAVAAGDVSGLTARLRAMCGDAKRRDMFMFDGDFFKIRWVTLFVPIPSAIIPGVRNASLTLSARNFYTWVKDDFLKNNPEMAGDGGLRQRVRIIGENVPPPARVTASLRVVF